MNWFHPTRTCPTHGKPLLVTQGGVVFCRDGLDANHNPTCIHEVPNARIPKTVRRAMQHVRRRTVKKLQAMQAATYDVVITTNGPQVRKRGRDV